MNMARHVLTHFARVLTVKAPTAMAPAEFESMSAAYRAKTMPQSEKVGLVAASEGRCCGCRLSRSVDELGILDAVDVIEDR